MFCLFAEELNAHILGTLPTQCTFLLSSLSFLGVLPSLGRQSFATMTSGPKFVWTYFEKSAEKDKYLTTNSQIHFSPSGGSSSGSGDTETCSEDGGEEGEEGPIEGGLVETREGLMESREGLVINREEGLVVSREKLEREEAYLISEGSPPYYRGARGMP